ncbi:response regulator [Ramlibacter sp. AN1015]|uniref:hybrid sensor histidine kinase/response regulator n=1 Tax=Ramlibacter sp. AN1015 TaxID=3133428 RepID=UPI0030C5270A
MQLVRFFRAIALVLLLLAAVLPVAAEHTPAPRAVAGRLELPAVPTAGPVLLLGEWGFSWQHFVDPGWQQLPTRGFAPVPEPWNALRADGKPEGEEGWGSYALLLNCPSGQSMALEAPMQRTASQLYVNGELVAAHGTAGASADSSRAQVPSRLSISREFACPLRLTLHISNFDHRAGGFVRALAAGSPDALARWREARLVERAALLSAYLLTGVVALIFFAVRRRERVPLVFGLFCLAMALYTDLIGARLLLRPFTDTTPWRTFARAEYLAWIVGMGLFLLTLRGLFPHEVSRRVTRAALALLVAAAVAVLALPTSRFSYIVLPGQAGAVVVGAYLLTAMLRAQRRAPADARALLAGMLAVVAALLLDLLLLDGTHPDQKFGPLGFALFLLSPAVVIARRMSHALNAEERSRTLEENARLREDVERISRHDLKTPLNSILGAARLLRDDPSLSPPQQELVGVLQRAALRMVEMVNLSLGLYKMETGSYPFRPEAVDLRGVVARVLVDLHSFAEAKGVLLHVEDGEGAGAPVQVRGEELLCYSIVANVVKNAIEATDSAGRVTISFGAGDPVSLTIHNPDAVVPDIAARMFQKYVTAGKRAGTGLGAYSARLMARTQRGDLVMRTGEAEGTTFTLTLPALREAPSPRVPAAPRQPAAQASIDELPLRHVLLVDDDEFSRFVTRQLLPDPPFRVEVAAHGQAATEIMLRHWPQLLLLDMEMPVMDGIETVRWVRRHEAVHALPRCGVVMLSGNDTEEAMARARQAGADRFLVKPVERERLLQTLHELEHDSRGASVTPPGR